MRFALLLLMAAALLMGCGEARHSSSLDLRLGTAAITLDSEDTENRLADRAWLLAAPVRARDPLCNAFDLSSSGHETFDGRKDGSAGQLTSGGLPDYEATGSPGDVLDVHVSATCTSGRDRGAHATASRRFEFPRLSCEGGTTPLVELSGPASMTDDSSDGQPHPLRPGDLLHADGETSVRLTGNAIVGTTECNGFEATLFPGTTVVGGYDAFGRGRSFVGKHVRLTGDRHAGGVAVLQTPRAKTVWAVTEDAPCQACVVPLPPSTLEELRNGHDAVVRVDQGAVIVRGTGRSIRLIAGQQVHITCRGETCTSTSLQRVRPGEPLSARTIARTRLASSLPGPTVPRHAALAPQFAGAQLRAIPRSAGEPSEIVVAWALQQQHGVLVWALQRQTWRRVYDFRSTDQFERITYAIGDVTHDGHPDVIVQAAGDGTADCRDFHVVAAVDGSVRPVFTRLQVCEAGDVSARDGNLAFAQIVGPCPTGTGGPHCYGGVKTATLRWGANGFHVVATTVRCVATPGGSTERAAARRRGSTCAR